MFSYDERMKAVKLYIQYDLSVAKAIRELGYPKNRHTLTNWYIEYKEMNNLHIKRLRKEKLSKEQNLIAYSIVETAKENNLKTYPYLTWLLEKIAQRVNEGITTTIPDELFPWSSKSPSSLKK